MSNPSGEVVAHRGGVRRDGRSGLVGVRKQHRIRRTRRPPLRRPRPRRSMRSRTPCPRTSSRPGKLVVGVNIPYTPNEFKDPSGKIVGFDVDLMNAIASTLGLTADYRESDFAKIIPSIQGGTFNVGMSSFTDTKEREQTGRFRRRTSRRARCGRSEPGAGIDPEQRVRQEGRRAGHHHPGNDGAARERARRAPTPASRRSRSCRSTGRTPRPTPWCSVRPTRCRRTRR